MTDRLLKPEEYETLLPWRCHEKGEVFVEIGGERVFIPRLTLIHLYQRYSEVVAGLAAKQH